MSDYLDQKLRQQKSYDTLEEIIAVLDHPFGDMHWVGKNYSRAALVRDLRAIQADLTEVAEGLVEVVELLDE